MDFELLYFDDCPSWQSALENLQAALAEEDLDAQIRLVNVQNTDQAQSLRFLGSPSIQIASVDFWPEERDGYFMGCRVYQTPEGLKGWPTVKMIRERLVSLFPNNLRGVR